MRTISTGRRLHLFALVVAGTTSAAGVANAAEFMMWGGGDGLVRRTYFVAPQETLYLQTTGCSDTVDSVIAVIEGTVSTTGPRTTAAFNDDSGGTYCSYTQFTNTTSATRVYEALIFSYSSETNGTVTYSVFRTSNPQWVSESVLIGGVNHQFTGDNFLYVYETYPMRVGSGGVNYGDTVLYAITPTSGGQTYSDDDSGLVRLSRFAAIMNCQRCWLVAGAYSSGTPVGLIRAVAMGAPDTDSDGLSDGLETIFGTNPTNWDSDGDGISDRVELVGIQQNTQTLVGYDSSVILPWEDTGSNPLQPDIFVQVDYMATGAHTHDPRAAGNWNTAATDLAGIFTSDTAFSGKNINVHFQFINNFALTETTHIGFEKSCPALTSYTPFYSIKNNP